VNKHYFSNGSTDCRNLAIQTNRRHCPECAKCVLKDGDLRNLVVRP
jgi:hypothetical protein